MSGTVEYKSTGNYIATGILFFSNLNRTIQTTATITNGEYSVLLVGGQSYQVFDGHFPTDDRVWPTSVDYLTFYVPLGVTTFTENLVTLY